MAAHQTQRHYAHGKKWALHGRQVGTARTKTQSNTAAGAVQHTLRLSAAQVARDKQETHKKERQRKRGLHRCCTKWQHVCLFTRQQQRSHNMRLNAAWSKRRRRARVSPCLSLAHYVRLRHQPPAAHRHCSSVLARAQQARAWRHACERRARRARHAPSKRGGVHK